METTLAPKVPQPVTTITRLAPTTVPLVLLADERNYMAVFQKALLGDLGPTPARVPAQVSAHAGESYEVPVAPAPIRVAAAPQPNRTEKLPTPRRSRKGRGLFITAGVLSILFGGLNLLILIGVMLDPEVGNATAFSGFAAFFIFIGTFGMLIIGGAAACGVNTLAGKVMLLIASLSMMTGHIVLGATGWIVDVIGILFAIISGLIVAFVIGSMARGRANLAT